MRQLRIAWQTGICCAVTGWLLIAVTAAHGQSAALKGDAARGASPAAACTGCHGLEPNAPLPGMPSLSGQQEEFLLLQMILLREGLRDVPMMSGMLKSFSDTDLADIAAYFGSQKPYREPATPDAARRQRGLELSQKLGCGSCHMPDYAGQRQVPRLVNQREDYLAMALKAYRDNKRSGTDTSMNAAMYQISDGDIEALAHYLATQ